jgi:hypothetical protein
MSASPEAALEKLIHDVTSKCVSIKNAAALLRSTQHQEAGELLTMMAQQAEKIAQVITEFERKRRS